HVLQAIAQAGAGGHRRQSSGSRPQVCAAPAVGEEPAPGDTAPGLATPAQAGPAHRAGPAAWQAGSHPVDAGLEVKQPAAGSAARAVATTACPPGRSANAVAEGATTAAASHAGAGTGKQRAGGGFAGTRQRQAARAIRLTTPGWRVPRVSGL